MKRGWYIYCRERVKVKSTSYIANIWTSIHHKVLIYDIPTSLGLFSSFPSILFKIIIILVINDKAVLILTAKSSLGNTAQPGIHTDVTIIILYRCVKRVVLNRH